MTLSLTVTATDPADLRRKLADILSGMGGGVRIIGDGHISTTPIVGAALKGASDQTVLKAEAGAAEQAEPTEATVTYDYLKEVKPAVLTVSQKHGREGVLELLKPYDVTNAQMIPDEKYPEFMAAIDAMLALTPEEFQAKYGEVV